MGIHPVLARFASGQNSGIPILTTVANLLSAKNLSKAFDSRPLFSEITFGIQDQEHLGLIGSNGSGKSTLLKILAGELDADDGDIVTQKNLRVSMLNQDPQFEPGKTIHDVLVAAADDPSDWQAYTQADELIWQLELNQLGLTGDSPIDPLSGGLKKRVAVAVSLMKKPQLLLLDEPTNHLDVEGILWLEDILKKSTFAFVVVTHDRLFLDRVCNRIMELDRRNVDGLLSVPGNYSRYLEVKEATLASLQGREESLRSIMRRETEWLKAGVRAQRSKQFARIQRHGELSDELRDVSQRNQTKTATLEFQSVDQSPKRLVEVKKLSKSYPDRGSLFQNLDLLLTPGTRLGVLGENGCGKSTLIRILLGEEQPDSGTIFRSDQLKVAYFEQNREKLDPSVSLMRTVCPYGDGVVYQGRSIHIRTYLDRFLFSKEQIDLPVGKLSGGERSRVVLAKLMLTECNLLVLDEPTNDLDIATLNVLQDCLTEFDGAILLVSHDRFFLDQVATEILAFPLNPEERRLGQLHKFADLAQWEGWHRIQLQTRPPVSGGRVRAQLPSSAPSSQVKRAPSDSKEIGRVTRKIEELEKQLKKLEDQFAAPETLSDQSKMIDLGKRMKALQTEIQSLYSQWESLQSED